jgi:asparagine synthase (glutamine-hydrolysing)
MVAVNPLSFAAFRQTPWHHFGLLALEQSQLSLRSPYLDNDFVKTVFRAPAAVLADNALCLRLIHDGAPALGRIRTDRGVAGTLPPLAGAVARAYQEFTFKAEYAYGHGMPQWLAQLDHLASPLRLERLFVGRHKFYHFRQWYRDELSGFVMEMLLDPRTLSRPYLQGATVEDMVRAHVKGHRNYTNTIHRVLTLELVHRLFLDSRSGESA